MLAAPPARVTGLIPAGCCHKAIVFLKRHLVLTQGISAQLDHFWLQRADPIEQCVVLIVHIAVAVDDNEFLICQLVLTVAGGVEEFAVGAVLKFGDTCRALPTRLKSNRPRRCVP